MCGIVGTLNLTRDFPIDASLLRRMLGAVRHRGPDQFGLYLFQDDQSSVGLGNARLSIIDLYSGQQPISNEDGTLWTVFNGEIFNYVELRPRLEANGHRLLTQSDTEVLLHLYEQYGPACLHHLNGQFAFAIWDERARTLFLARDRLGIRPLYYTVQDGVLIFASEIKALLADPRVTASIDPLALDQAFTYWSPLSPRTAFEGIRTLPPGHWLRAGPDGEIEIEQYWALTYAAENTGPSASIDDCAAQLRDLLADATRIRLRADVPVGAYLSGGLDSSTITALSHQTAGVQLETFSVAFVDQAFDESFFQRQMAHHLGTRHQMITCSHDDIGRVFPDVVWHAETPLLRTSPAPLYLLSRLVHQHGLKVVLTGEGADETLAGYNIFKEQKVRRFWSRQPESKWRPMLLKRLYPYIDGLAKGGDAYLEKFFGQGLLDVDRPDYSHRIRWRNTSRCKRLFSRELQQTIADQRNSQQTAAPCLPDGSMQWSPLARAQYLETTIFLAEYLLSSQGDRVAMAHSVEGRFPFLDHRVVDFCNQLPPRYKLRGLDEKHILKRAARDLLPSDIRQRPKQPYRAPIHRSLFPHGTPLDWVAEVLSPTQLTAAGCFAPKATNALLTKLERFGTLSETDDMALAGLVSTQLLYQQFVSAFRPPAALNELDDVKLVLRRNARAPAGRQTFANRTRNDDD